MLCCKKTDKARGSGTDTKKNTRRLLADALRTLVRTRPLDRITVRDIVERCGVGRQTFYYYFRDKYDLMNWVYAEEAQPYTGRQSGDWTDGLTGLCRHMRRNRGFYQNALRTTGQDSYPDFLRRFVCTTAMDSIAVISGGRDIDPEKFRFVVEFCSIALIGMLVDWAQRGMKEDPAVYVEKMRSILDGSAVRQIYGTDENEDDR